jgi:hypothetical protein
VWDMKNRIIPLLTLVAGLVLAALGVMDLFYTEPVSQTPTGNMSLNVNTSSLQTNFESGKPENTSVSNSAISSLFVHRQVVKAVAPPLVVQTPAPEKAPVNGNGILQYLGYVSSENGTRKYYFKDIQKNIPISSLENDEKSSLVILKNSETSFTVRYGGTMYDIPKK